MSDFKAHVLNHYPLQESQDRNWGFGGGGEGCVWGVLGGLEWTVGNFGECGEGFGGGIGGPHSF